MENFTLTGMDLIQIALLLFACYCCRVSGYQKGIVDTLEYFDKNGIIEIGKDPDEEAEEKR